MDLYIGGVAPEIKQDTLARIFSAIGPVLSVKLMLDRQSRRPTGFAVVDMQEDVAEAAIASFNGKSLGGHVISVSGRRPKSKPSLSASA